MDDVYENLDNYNFAQVQTENLELKNKLQEITSQLTKVQSDYDNLKEEFKKLETHYSSLLKTAKGEIQRKTALISTLNTEKDKLIISHVLNGGAINSVYNNGTYDRGHFYKEQDKRNVNSFNEFKKSEESRLKDPRVKESIHEKPIHNRDHTHNEQDKRNKNSYNEFKKTEESRLKDSRIKEFLHENKPESRKLHYYSDKEDHRTKNNTDKNSRSRSKEKYYSRKNDISSHSCERPNKNIDKYVDYKNYKIAQVRQRRKSVHVEKSRYISSSSEDENNENESRGKYKKDRLIQYHYRKQSHSPIIFDLRNSDRLSRNNCRDVKYMQNNRGRSREKFYRKQSPFLESRKRNRSRCYEESVDTQTERRSNERVRILQSPSSYKSKDLSPKDLLHDKNKENNYETRPIKHKFECDEQIKNKRLRTDDHNSEIRTDNLESCYKTNTKLIYSKNSELAPSDHVDSSSVKNNDNQLEKRENIKEIREIKKLKTNWDPKEPTETEIDPRLSSNKYVKALDAKDNVYITTLVDNNLDLKYIKYDNTPQLTFPTPLNCVDLDENHVNEIYMDIDRQVNYMSPESGELLDSEGTTDVYFSEPSNQCDESLSSRKNNTNVILPNSEKKQLNAKQTKDASQISFSPKETPVNTCEMTVFGNYKIPKFSNTNKRDFVKISTTEPNYKNTSVASKNNNKVLTYDRVSNNIENTIESPTNILQEDTKTDFINKMIALRDAESPKYRQFIAQDLELSDENNDSQELTDISDATLNTTGKEAFHYNIESDEKNIRKLSTKTEPITSKCSDLLSESLISPEDLELSIHTNSVPLQKSDIMDKKNKEEDVVLEDKTGPVRKDKKEKSNKTKEKSKHKKKSSKKDKEHAAKVNSSNSDSPTEKSNMSKDNNISNDVLEPVNVSLPACDTNNSVVIDRQYCGERTKDLGSPNVSVYEVSSSVPVSRLTTPTQSPNSAAGFTGSPRTDVSQPDLRIVIKRRRTIKKKT